MFNIYVMRFGGMTLEDLHDNIFKYQTVCTLNDKKSTCLPQNFIQYIYNKQNKENITDSNTEIIIDKISKECGCDKETDINKKELCIIKNTKDYIINKDEKDCILYNYFKPEGSHDGKAWLNNTHVDLIQEQLYKKYKNYYYSFIHMIDNVMITPQNLKCIKHPVKSITDINFINEVSEDSENEFKENGKMNFYGIVYNTDPSHKSGQHWFCILFNFSTEGTEQDPYIIEYFNSSGLDIANIDFKTYLETLAANISYKTDKRVILKKITDIQHQKDSTGNCGIYCLYYIWSRLENIPLEKFNDPNNKITDETMENFRKIMFRKEE